MIFEGKREFQVVASWVCEECADATLTTFRDKFGGLQNV